MIDFSYWLKNIACCGERLTVPRRSSALSFERHSQDRDVFEIKLMLWAAPPEDTWGRMTRDSSSAEDSLLK